ncbi:MAG: hypothetical protein RML46_02790 [Anaerolineae bacterium]|nr:hypothetical protein [Anaerolineae bacterium]MDW8067823.1 hypothetical protein [Anaerolineae bacterium]
MAPVWIHTLIRILLILAHLAGLVVAVLLLARYQGKAPILATVGFALLVLGDATQAVQVYILSPIARQVSVLRFLPWLGSSLACCWGFQYFIGWGCLIAALWMGISRPETEPDRGTPD